MRRLACTILAILPAALAGCQQQSAPPPVATTRPVAVDEVVATIDGLPITANQIAKPLIAHYGNASLQILVYTMQLELARAEARKLNLGVSPQDVTDELGHSLRMVFPDQNTEKLDVEQARNVLVPRLKISPVAFDLWLETNANLRKIVRRTIESAVNEEVLRNAFNVLYGQTAVVRHIQLANPLEVAEAQRALADGQTFEAVATRLSRDRLTAVDGGLMRPFSRNSPNVPEALKQVAFSLKPGEVSAPVQSGEWYHLVKLMETVAPKAVKFEDPEVQQVVRRWYVEGLMGNAINEARRLLWLSARDRIAILHPQLKARYQEELERHRAMEQSADELRRKFAAEQARLSATQPTTQPATAATTTSTAGAAAPTTAERPPATGPKGP